jgi:hypothetical protein
MREQVREVLVCSICLTILSNLLFGQAMISPAIQLVEHLDYLSPIAGAAAREPMIVEHPDGSLFVSGYGYQEKPPQKVPRLWKSLDHGATWSAVNVGTEVDGAIGNSDVDLAVARDGTIYFVTMGFDLKKQEGTHIAVGVSRDGGSTWHWTTLSQNRFDDRPWVAVAPDGTAHVIWNDGTGVYHTLSHNRGATWSKPQRIHAKGGSSHLAVGPHGEIAVRVVPISASGNKYDEGVDLIETSTDEGSTWQERRVPGERDWAPLSTPGAIPRWVEPVAWDETGALYLLWTDLKGLWLGRSGDRGQHWSKWLLGQTDALLYYPYLTARGNGELAATWYSGVGQNLHWEAGRIRFSRQEEEPHMMRSSLLSTDSWYGADEHGNAPGRDTAGEYTGNLILSDGDLAVVTPIQNAAEKRFGFGFWRFKANP